MSSRGKTPLVEFGSRRRSSGESSLMSVKGNGRTRHEPADAERADRMHRTSDPDVQEQQESSKGSLENLWKIEENSEDWRSLAKELNDMITHKIQDLEEGSGRAKGQKLVEDAREITKKFGTPGSTSEGNKFRNMDAKATTTTLPTIRDTEQYLIDVLDKLQSHVNDLSQNVHGQQSQLTSLQSMSRLIQNGRRALQILGRYSNTISGKLNALVKDLDFRIDIVNRHLNKWAASITAVVQYALEKQKSNFTSVASIKKWYSDERSSLQNLTELSSPTLSELYSLFPMESVQLSPVRGTSCDKTPSQTATDTSSRTEGDDGMESGWQNEPDTTTSVHLLAHPPMLQHPPVMGTSYDKTPYQTASENTSIWEGDDGMETVWPNQECRRDPDSEPQMQLRKDQEFRQWNELISNLIERITGEIDKIDKASDRSKLKSMSEQAIYASSKLVNVVFKLKGNLETFFRELKKLFEKCSTAAQQHLLRALVEKFERNSLNPLVTDTEGLSKKLNKLGKELDFRQNLVNKIAQQGASTLSTVVESFLTEQRSNFVPCRFRDDMMVPEASARVEPSYTVSGADDYSISKQQSETSPDFSKLKTFVDLIARNAEVEANEREEAKPEKAISDPPREGQYIQSEVETEGRTADHQTLIRRLLDTLMGKLEEDKASYTSELHKAISETYQTFESVKTEVNQLKENLFQKFMEIHRTVESFMLSNTNLQKRLPKAIYRIIDMCKGDLEKLLLKTDQTLGNIVKIEKQRELSATGFFQNLSSFVQQSVDNLLLDSIQTKAYLPSIAKPFVQTFL